MRALVGVSRSSDTRLAVQEAVAQGLARRGDEPVIGGLVFLGADFDLPAAAEALAVLLPDVPLIGCTTDGEISPEGLSVDSMVVVLLASRRVRAQAAVVRGLSQDSHAAGRTLAGALRSPDARVLLMLPDGLTGNGSAVIRGAREVLGDAFVMAGGTAGDRGRFQRTFQLGGGAVHTDALVGLMLASEHPLEVGFGVMAGWAPMGIAKEVTRAEHNTVYRIEGETALQVYSRFLGDKAAELPAIGVEYPFALMDRHGQVDTRGIREGEEYLLMRAPMRVDHSDGSVTFAAEIPQGSMIKMTRAKSQDVIEAAREAARRSLAGLGGPPDVAFFFSCMARKIVLGRKTVQEIRVAQEVIGPDVPLAGFYTYGEIANCGTTRPVCRFHNETATFLTIRET